MYTSIDNLPTAPSRPLQSISSYIHLSSSQPPVSEYATTVIYTYIASLNESRLLRNLPLTNIPPLCSRSKAYIVSCSPRFPIALPCSLSAPTVLPPATPHSFTRSHLAFCVGNFKRRNAFARLRQPDMPIIVAAVVAAIIK